MDGDSVLDTTSGFSGWRQFLRLLFILLLGILAFGLRTISHEGV